MEVSNALDLDGVVPKSVVKSVGVVAMNDFGSDDLGDMGGTSFVVVVVFVLLMPSVTVAGFLNEPLVS